jgi:hypothetical protein
MSSTAGAVLPDAATRLQTAGRFNCSNKSLFTHELPDRKKNEYIFNAIMFATQRICIVDVAGAVHVGYGGHR